MKTFKGLPVCEKHGVPYKYRDGCLKCKRERPKPKGEKPLDKALRELEAEYGPMKKYNDKNGNNNN